MKCEECLFQVEEYLERETDLRYAEPVLEHISACPECKGVYDYLQMEQKVFATYLQNIEASPTLWAGLEARIKAEKTAQPAAAVDDSTKFLGARIRFMFQPWRSDYALSGCVAFLLVGVFTALLTSLFSDQTAYDRKIESPMEMTKQAPAAGNLIENPEEQSAGGDKRNNSFRTRKNSENKSRRTGLTFFGDLQKSKQAGQRSVPAAAAAPVSKPGNENFRGKDLGVDKGFNAALKPAPYQTDNLEGETRKQVERVELLLRSFRNTLMTESELAVHVNYDKNQARKLLQKNILLRQGAENKGKIDIEEVLASLEPFLLDIANLSDAVSPEEVRAIKNRIREQQIVAALQIY